jgi:hypothetical protein
MSTSAMHRLRAANPVPQAPASRPIDAVLPGWPKLDGAGNDRPRIPEPRDAACPSRTRLSAGSRIRRGIPAVTGAAVAMAVAITALIAVHPAKPPSGTATSPTSQRTYTDPQGWSITYPSAFRLESQPKGAIVGLLAGQVTLMSFSAPRKLMGRPSHQGRANIFQAPYTLPLDASGRFPADGAALILQASGVGILAADSAFPVALSQFGRPHTERFFSNADYRRDTIPLARTREIVAYGRELTAVALIGANAPPTLRAELANAIASLSFPRLAPGTGVGAAVVLGPASRYPVGSFTLVHARFLNGRTEPIYLVHAPGRLTYGHDCRGDGPCTAAGAFYGIGPEYNTRDTHAPLCQLRLDRQHDDFYCNNLGVSWDRVGRVIARPSSEAYIGSNEALYAKVAWDGQVMIMQGWGPQLNRAAVHELWPAWRQPTEPLSR